MHKNLLPIVAIAACAGTRAPQAPTASDVHDYAVAGIVGVWRGDAIGTPFGDFPIAIAFDREPGGDVHGRLDDGKGMYLDFRWRRDNDRWMLVETGAMPNADAQTMTLVPVAGRARWSATDPVELAVDIALDGDALALTATLAGKPHASLRLRRARGLAADTIRRMIAQGPGPGAE